MVRLATFDGIKIYIYPGEHPPPHVHVIYAEFVALITIEPAKIDKGYLPVSVERRVLEWVADHREKLLEAWVRVGNKQKPEKLS